MSGRRILIVPMGLVGLAVLAELRGWGILNNLAVPAWAAVMSHSFLSTGMAAAYVMNARPLQTREAQNPASHPSNRFRTCSTCRPFQVAGYGVSSPRCPRR